MSNPGILQFSGRCDLSDINTKCFTDLRSGASFSTSGNTLTVSYNTAGLVNVVKNADGESVTIDYGTGATASLITSFLERADTAGAASAAATLDPLPPPLLF